MGPAVQRALREIEERARRRQAEALLRASERNYREIFNATNDAYFLHDAATGAILDVNQQGVGHFGYTREEMRDASSRAINSAPAGRSPMRTRFAESGRRLWRVPRCLNGAASGGTASCSGMRSLCERRTSEARSASLLSCGTSPGARPWEEALRNSEHRSRILFEYAPDAYSLYDLQGKFVDGNKAAEALSGYQREELHREEFPRVEPAHA